MFKPTKKQHVVNKAYVDQNGSSGGGAEPLIVTVNSTGNIRTLDKTWQEIHDVFVGGRAMIVHPNNTTNYYHVTGVTMGTDPTGATIYSVGDSVNFTYETNSADGYPQYDVSED